MAHVLKYLMVVASLTVTYGHYYNGQNPNPFYQPFRYGYKTPHVVYGHQVKHQIPAFLPLSPTFQVEIMKPMAQLEEQKTVRLFIIPQNSLHVFPHIQRTPARFVNSANQFPELTNLMGDPSHLPAVEIPLQSPMVVGAIESKVLAPAGFTVLLKGPYGEAMPFPIHTGVLLAPVPAGTIVSAETPVVLNTIYAVPSLPSLPSYYPFVVDLPSKVVGGPIKGTTLITPLPISTSTQKIQTTHLIPSSPPVNFVSSTTPIVFDQPTVGITYPSSITPPTTLFQQDAQIDNEVLGPNIIGLSPPGPVSGSSAELDNRPFSNAKESPYLQELRDQSIQSIESEIANLQHRLQQIRNN